MSIKGDKTFEEIVERLVALFRPQAEDAAADAGAQTASSEPAERSPSPSIRTSSDEDAPN
jgi:hypothetical protein